MTGSFLKVIANPDFLTGVTVGVLLVSSLRFSSIFRHAALAIVGGLLVWSYLGDGGVTGILNFARAAKFDASQHPSFLYGAATGVTLTTIALLSFRTAKRPS